MVDPHVYQVRVEFDVAYYSLLQVGEFSVRVLLGTFSRELGLNADLVHELAYSLSFIEITNSWEHWDRCMVEQCGSIWSNLL